jgi:selenium-dependent xanthine dehydrogenase
MRAITFELNGAIREVQPRPGESLLETLRERCGIRSVKDGCRPQAQCGCCLALVDGSPRTTCATPAEKAHGTRIVTLEGLEPEERELLAGAFLTAGALQCGYCIPGIALRARWLLEKNPTPSGDQIRRAIDGHLCRCTGYTKIVEAIETLSRARQGAPLPPLLTDGGVGARLVRHEGVERVLGMRPFVDDLVVAGLLHGALVLSPHARARILAIDTSRAAALPGVLAVATARDVPGERWYGLIEADWPGLVAEGEEVRCVGDVLAAVAAVDEATAREAAALVEVRYELLEPVLDPEQALRAGAPQVNPRHANLLSRTRLHRGDVDAALAASAHVVHGTWQTQRIEHLFLEPESCVAVPLEGGRLHLYCQSQGIFDDRRQVAGFLGMREEDVSVELVPSGGGFGGKEDLSVQAHAALLARLSGRPVKLTLRRDESVRMHPKRHPMTLQYTAGCDAEGRLTAVRARILGDSGAYASVGKKVLERAAAHACGPYRVAAVDVEAAAVYTNNPPSGAMRGFGAPQAAFAIEGCLDLLAERLGLDPWQMRWQNAVEVGDTLATGQVLEKSVGLKQTLLAVKPAYEAAVLAGRAVGIACGIKNSGLGNGARERGRARLAVEADGSVGLYVGFTEMGQGLHTVLVQCAVEVTGLAAACFRPRTDSRFDLSSGQTTGSRGTLLGGRAVAEAARRLRADLDREGSVAALAGRVYEGEILIEDTTALGQPAERIKTHTSYGFATQLCILDAAGRVERFVAAHDVGRALNPAFCEAQIEGAVHMGLGYALTEELRCEQGMPVTLSLRDLGVLRARDMPELEVILVEEPEPEGPFGAKGVGEIGLVPTAAAVAGALARHDGIRRYRLPMKDSAAARAMSVGRTRERRAP